MQHIPIIPPSTKNRRRKHLNARLETARTILCVVVVITIGYILISYLP